MSSMDVTLCSDVILMLEILLKFLMLLLMMLMCVDFVNDVGGMFLMF